LNTGMLRVGWVVAYDVLRGLGTVSETADGDGPGAGYRFHCTAIADGSRAIDPGTEVAFLVTAGLGGVLEARSVTALGPPGR